MPVLLILLLIFVAGGGYGGPLVGFGSYGYASTGLTTVAVIMLLLWIFSSRTVP